MTPGLVIKEGRRIRIRQLREDDIPRMAAHGFGGEEGARRWYAQELEKGDGPSREFWQFAVETKSGERIGFTGFYGDGASHIAVTAAGGSWSFLTCSV